MAGEKILTLGLKFRQSNPFIRYLAIKAHEQAKAPSSGEAAGAAVFVSGLPFGADERVLSEMFECFGPVSQAVLHPLKVRASGCVCVPWVMNSSYCSAQLCVTSILFFRTRPSLRLDMNNLEYCGFCDIDFEVLFPILTNLPFALAALSEAALSFSGLRSGGRRCSGMLPEAKSSNMTMDGIIATLVARMVQTSLSV